MAWTTEKLKALSGDDLWRVFDNFQEKDSPEAQIVSGRILAMLAEKSDLSVGETGLAIDSSFGKRLSQVINSKEAVSTALEATRTGKPALSGVEPLVLAKFGLGYSKRFEANIQAGYLLSLMMKRLGHEMTEVKGPMPPGGVVKSSEIYRLKS